MCACLPKKFQFRTCLLSYKVGVVPPVPRGVPRVGGLPRGLRDLQEEVTAATSQGSFPTVDIVSQGLGLIVQSDGRVVRRGLGVPEWKAVLLELKKKQ